MTGMELVHKLIKLGPKVLQSEIIHNEDGKYTLSQDIKVCTGWQDIEHEPNGIPPKFKDYILIEGKF